MKKATLIYVGVNAACMLAFSLIVIRIFQRMQMEQRNYSDFGDNFGFLFTGVPLLLISAIYSVGWGIGSVVEVMRHRIYQGLVALGLVVGAWAVLIVALRSVQ